MSKGEDSRSHTARRNADTAQQAGLRAGEGEGELLASRRLPVHRMHSGEKAARTPLTVAGAAPALPPPGWAATHRFPVSSLERMLEGHL